MRVDRDAGDELASHEELFAKLGARLPAALEARRGQMHEKLTASSVAAPYRRVATQAAARARAEVLEQSAVRAQRRFRRPQSSALATR